MIKKIILVFISTLIGCASYENTEEYKNIWQATQKVLARNNLSVKESLYREGTIVAVSKINGDFLNKSRVKVVARIVEDEDGYLEPAIKVISQWDNSDVNTTGRPEYQPKTRWINLGSNASFEAKLYNEIQQELGKNNYYEAKAWKPPVSSSEKPLDSSYSLEDDYIPSAIDGSIIEDENNENELEDVE